MMQKRHKKLRKGIKEKKNTSKIKRFFGVQNTGIGTATVFYAGNADRNRPQRMRIFKK
jgi:hypothetical protein